MRLDFLKTKIGAAFFWTVLMIGILGIMAGALAKVVSKDVFTAQYLKYSTQAFFLADAGINHTFSQLKANFSDATITNTISLGAYDGTYDVVITTYGNNKVATSKGTVKGVKRTVVAEFSEAVPYDAFDYAVFANRNISNDSFIGAIIVNGDMFANVDVILKGSLLLIIDINAYGGRRGAVYAYHEAPIIDGLFIFVNADGGFHKASSPPIPPPIPIPFPTLDFDYYKNLAQDPNKNNIYIPNPSGGTQIWYGHESITPTDGIVYVNGNVEFKKKHWYHLTEDVNLNGCLVVTGYVKNNAGIIVKHTKFSNLPAILSQGDIGGLGALNVDGLVYSRGGTINSLFGTKRGCLMASNDVKLNGPGGLLGLLNLTWSRENPLDLKKVTMVAWSE